MREEWNESQKNDLFNQPFSLVPKNFALIAARFRWPLESAANTRDNLRSRSDLSLLEFRSLTRVQPLSAKTPLAEELYTKKESKWEHPGP